MLFQCKFKSAPTLKYEEPMTADQCYFWEIDNLLKTVDIMLNDSRNFLIYTLNANYTYHFLPQWLTSCLPFYSDDSLDTVSYNGGLNNNNHFPLHLHHLFTLMILSGLKRMIIGMKTPTFTYGMQLLQVNGKLLLYHLDVEIFPLLLLLLWHHDNDNGPSIIK